MALEPINMQGFGIHTPSEGVTLTEIIQHWMIPGTMEGPEIPPDWTKIWRTGLVAMINPHGLGVCVHRVTVDARPVNKDGVPHWLSRFSLVPYTNALKTDEVLLAPIDPRMTLTDITGASVAYPNEAGTHWLFKHTDDNHHHNHEKLLATAVHTCFEDEVDGASVKAMEATNAVTKTSAVNILRGLLDFRSDVKEAVLTEAQTRHLGYYHQNPDDAHIHHPVLRALNKTILDWQVNHPTRYRLISSPLANILKEESKRHTYETRWDQEVRIQAEKEAEEA